MIAIAFSLAAGAALALAPPAAEGPAAAPAPTEAPTESVEVPFTGQTAADAKLRRDALEELHRFTARSLRCASATAVQSSILPDGWQPSDPNFRIALPGTRYERWWVTLCGRIEPFLVSFWPDAKAGPQFMVAHPFPADPTPPKP